MPLWSPRSPNRPVFHPTERVEIEIVDVTALNEEQYFVHASLPDPLMGAAGGYAFSIFGLTGGLYYREGNEILAPGYRVHLKVDSDPDRHGFTEGALGGGTLHREYAEVGISLQHDYVRDILYELRRDQDRVLRVAGPATGIDTFRVDMFMLSSSNA